MAAYEIRPTTVADIHHVAEHAREADREELWAAGFASPLRTLLLGARLSPEVFTAVIDGEPVAVFGVTPLSVITAYGAPWMVSTHAVDRHATAFIRASRPVFDEVFEKWDSLENFVDARNTRAIRWLKYLGFTIHDPVIYGKLGLLFHPFTKARR